MKLVFLKCWFAVSMLVLITLIAWIRGNMKCVISADPEKATRAVVHKYNPSRAQSAISVLPIGYVHSVPAGPGIIFQVKEAALPVARIMVRSFLGMGWQEAEFERIENSDQADGANDEERDRATVPVDHPCALLVRAHPER